MPNTIGRPLSWYDCAPDYLYGEEEIRGEDERAAQEAEDDHIEELLERRRGD